jgi:hypothetical protein
VGNWDFNTGNYVLQFPAPSCSVTGVAPCIPGGVLPEHVIVEPQPGKSLVETPLDNFGPRLGLAYRINDATAIRAAYALFYDTWAATTQNQLNYSFSWPNIGVLGTPPLNLTTVTANAESPFGSGDFFLPAPTPYFNQVHFADPRASDAKSQQWHFQLQRQLPGDTVLAVGYVGSHTTRVPVFFSQNVATTPGPGDPMLRAPFPYAVAQPYFKTIGKAGYNSLQVSLEKRATSGLTYVLSYTYSKALNFGCDGNFSNCDIQDPNHWQNNYGVAGFDQTHNLTFSWVWQLPFGRGRRWEAGRGVLSTLVGNWQFNGIGFLASGLPYGVSAPGDIANIGGGTERADLIGNAFAGTNRLQPINPGAFAFPAPYTFGNLGRNVFRSASLKNMDLSLFREFPVPWREATKVQFRWEVFNAFNGVVFGVPDTFLGDPNFGQVSRTNNTERRMQFALKLYF